MTDSRDRDMIAATAVIGVYYPIAEALATELLRQAGGGFDFGPIRDRLMEIAKGTTTDFGDEIELKIVEGQLSLIEVFFGDAAKERRMKDLDGA